MCTAHNGARMVDKLLCKKMVLMTFTDSLDQRLHTGFEIDRRVVEHDDEKHVAEGEQEVDGYILGVSAGTEMPLWICVESN